MNFARTFALAMLSCSVLAGCDAIRSALGKPTSEDIAALRLQREQMKRTADSLALALGGEPDSSAAPYADSLAGTPAADSLSSGAAADSTATGSSLSNSAEALAAEGGAAEGASGSAANGTASQAAGAAKASPAAEGAEASGAAADTLQSGFYVVLGSFKNEDNARYLFNSLSASGCDVHLVEMKNGFTAVMICRGDTYEDSYGKMLEFYGEKAHPDDIWIYNTSKHLHIQ